MKKEANFPHKTYAVLLNLGSRSRYIILHLLFAPLHPTKSETGDTCRPGPTWTPLHSCNSTSSTVPAVNSIESFHTVSSKIVHACLTILDNDALRTVTPTRAHPGRVGLLGSPLGTNQHRRHWRHILKHFPRSIYDPRDRARRGEGTMKNCIV